ncbi:MAG: hypothetical protein RLZZ543_953 [Bacteroidota bacterium]|jgi:arsenate reductase-like glutaredoxin family protein
MTDLQSLWNQHQKRQEELPVINATDLEQLHSKTQSPLMVLRRNLIVNSGFALVILIGFCVLLFMEEGFLFRLFMGIVCLAYVVAIYFNYWIYRNYLKEPENDSDIITYLKQLSKGLRKAFRSAEIGGLIVYPFAMTAGFLLPLSQEGLVDLLFTNSVVQLVLIGCYIVFTPLCWWIARKMNDVAFGKYVTQLEELVGELEQKEESESSAS